MRIIAGQWRGRMLEAPPGQRTRPTTDRVREAWMSALQPELPGSRVLDLFAGSGALGLEALSRGAATVTFVERAAGALRALRANIAKLEANALVEVIRGEGLRFASGLAAAAYDIALADPPYERGVATRLVRIYQRTAFAGSLWVEHGIREALPTVPGARQRRYGDTMITSYPATV